MKSEKQSAVVHFTIHALKLPEYTEGEFQIEYKRGNHSGITERTLVGRDNEVPFEKDFRCSVTLIKSDKSSTIPYKNKKIEFTVYRYKKSARKVFGKFNINAADFLVPRTETFEVKSPHKLASYVEMAVSVILTNRTSAIANDLESQSEAIQLQTDRQEDWDVSDLVTPESQERIQNFFMKREDEKNKQRLSLSEFAKSDKQSKARSRYHHVRRNSIDLLNLQATSLSALTEAANQAENDLNSAMSLKNQEITPSFKTLETDPEKTVSTPTIEFSDFSQFLRKKRAPLPVPPSKRKPETPDKTHHHKHQRIVIDEHCEDGLTEEKPAEPPKITSEEQKECNIRFLRSLLAKTWEASPLDMSKYPISASVIVSALIETEALSKEPKILNLDDQNDLIGTFCEQFQSSVLISNFAESTEKWFLTTNIMATIKFIDEEYKFNEILVYNLFSHLKQFLDNCFHDVLNARFGPFQQISTNLLDGSFDEMKVAKSLNESIRIFNALLGLPEKLFDFFDRNLLKYFDRYLVKTVLDHPDYCSLKNAIQWNTIITVLSDQEIYRTNIVLFRQVASILMMPMMICGTPEATNDICPNLDPAIVCTILANQKIDEFLLTPNDTTMFMEYYKLTPGQINSTFDVFDFKLDYDVIYGDVYHCSEWKNAKFTGSLLETYPYLRNYFV